MNTAERDALLAKLKEARSSRTIGDGLNGLIDAFALLVKALPVEDSFSSEELAAISADDSAPQPDFAAMAKELFAVCVAAADADDGSSSRKAAERWLAANWPKPPPASVERDKTWWTDITTSVVNLAHAQESDRYRWVMAKLRETFAAPVAFDVEAFIASVKRDLGNSTHWAADSIRMVGETMRAVAKQMGVL